MSAPLLRLRWDAATIAARVRAIAAELGARHRDDPLLLVTVLKGGTVFLADLIRALPQPVEVDFLAIRRRGRAGGRSGDTQDVALTRDLDRPVEGRHVVLVEDLIDSGVTVDYLLRSLAARGPASLGVCTLLDRPTHRLVDLPLDHVGFTVSEPLLVGYGLDLGGWFRHLPGLWEVLDEPGVRADPATALAQALAAAPGPVVEAPEGRT